MDIIAKRQEIRKARIEEIEIALKIYIEKLGKSNLNFTYESIVMAVETNFYCTKRYAREYVDLALYKVELEKSDLLPSWNKKKGVRFQLIKNIREMGRSILK